MSASKKIPEGRLCWLISLALFAGTVLLYLPAIRFDFVGFDDPDFILNNPLTLHGLTKNGIIAAFKATTVGNWHPLTLLTHMLDCQLYGTHAGGHHLTNLLLHAAASALLFVALHALTETIWRSAFVAALFAWHPMHVESVAWIAERKDILSALFFAATLWAHARYSHEFKVRNSKFKVYYVLALLFFALGLMSKPMLVTLPFVLILLDYWPLGRFTTFKRVLLEKIPLFVLTIAGCVITIWAQGKDAPFVSTAAVPIGTRLENAAIACVTYVGKLFWPSSMSVFYPYQASISSSQAATSALFLLIISVAVLVLIRRRPYLAVGWFLFLGMLVPVSGIVQVGSQTLADRFTYLPYIGLFIMLAWGVPDLALPSPRRNGILALGGGLALAACVAVSSCQLQYWRNTVTLFEHALNVTTGNFIACNNLAYFLVNKGQYDETLRRYPEPCGAPPKYCATENNLRAILDREGSLAHAERDYTTALHSGSGDSTTTRRDLGDVYLLAEGNLDAAHAQYEAALLSKPDSAEAQTGLAGVKERQEELDKAITYYQEAIKMRPRDVHAYNNLGDVYSSLYKMDLASAVYERGIRADPNSAQAHFNLGRMRTIEGRLPEAIEEFKAVVRLDPENIMAQAQLAGTLTSVGNSAEALPYLRNVAKAQPDNARAHFDLAGACMAQGLNDEAYDSSKAATRLAPQNPFFLNQLAWLEATCPQNNIRNPTEAVQLATQACEFAGRRGYRLLDTLAAAYAGAGHFEEAIRTAEEAQTKATAAGDNSRAEEIAQRLALYRTNKPFIAGQGTP